MSERKQISISDIIELIGGGTPKTNRADYWNGDIPWLSVVDFNIGRKYVIETEKKISQLGLKNSSAKLLNMGDLIISARGTVGIVAVLSKPMAFNQSCYGIRANDLSTNNFVYYLLKDRVSNFHQVSHGGVFDTITRDTFREIYISLPPLPEQKAIAEVLSSLDDKIELLHRQNKTLEAMAETLFRQWFVEEAKEEWEEARLDEFITVKHGYAFKGRNITSDPTNLILVTPGNFKIGGGFKSDKFKYLNSGGFPSDYVFKDGDLVVTMTDLSVDGDTLGAPALIPHAERDIYYLHNQRVGKVEFKKKFGKYYLYNLMKTEQYKWFILSGASGTSIRHTSPSSIGSFSFSSPCIEKIDKYENLVIPIFDKIDTNNNQIKTLEKLRDSLLPKLMSRELQISIN